MSKKNKPSNNGYVFSTDPDFKFETEEEMLEETLPASQQKLKVCLETRHRAGKTVTLVEGFKGTAADADLLGKELKNSCGTGGSVKGSEIIIQGDQRDKVLQYLLKKGYTQTRKL